MTDGQGKEEMVFSTATHGKSDERVKRDEADEGVVGLIEPSSPLLSSVVASSQLADVEQFTFTCRGFAIVSQLCFAIDTR